MDSVLSTCFSSQEGFTAIAELHIVTAVLLPVSELAQICSLHCSALQRLVGTGCLLVRKAECACQEAGHIEVCDGKVSSGWERGESAKR